MEDVDVDVDVAVWGRGGGWMGDCEEWSFDAIIVS